MSMRIVQANELVATRGSETESECIVSTIAVNLCPFSMMAFNPRISFSNAGVACGSMLIASAAYNSFWASSHFASRQSAIRRLAISSVFIGQWVNCADDPELGVTVGWDL